MKRQRNAKIVATLGPASSDTATIERLFDAGADVFRLNLSHGTHADHRARYERIREIEARRNRPIGVLLDLQGPKLRIDRFAQGSVQLAPGAGFRLDLDTARAGDATRVALPHPEIFAALAPGAELLLDDGRIRLRVQRCGPDFAETEVIAGSALSDRKGVNVPGGRAVGRIVRGQISGAGGREDERHHRADGERSAVPRADRRRTYAGGADHGRRDRLRDATRGGAWRRCCSRPPSSCTPHPATRRNEWRASAPRRRS